MNHSLFSLYWKILTSLTTHYNPQPCPITAALMLEFTGNVLKRVVCAHVFTYSPSILSGIHWFIRLSFSSLPNLLRSRSMIMLMVHFRFLSILDMQLKLAQAITLPPSRNTFFAAWSPSPLAVLYLSVRSLLFFASFSSPGI